MNPEQFQMALAQHQVALTDHQLNQFEEYYRLLVATNKHVNLTAITDEQEVYLKHFYDSLTGAFVFSKIREPLSLCDIGAGAGFPSLPLKIAFPQLRVTIVDSLNKRINFLQDLVDKLGLDNVTLIHARAEDFANAKSKHREKFDVVTARAVANLTVLSELCLPAVRVGGCFLAYKGRGGQEELTAAKGAITKLGGQLEQSAELTLPKSDDDRQLIIIKKVKETPKRYPRRPGIPAKKPFK
ncbi:MAG: 16S rRNA (guanine(527)-N(7))-methyltransferase RsmG [[Lactobacillus] timonensis]|uniref:16S rRNA (guanine(527)-N(7))-methyltransferase RsmG n=1 Tax=[Lactobacillus] timonensis TaxID=1970790 RepID=UPI002355DFE0|nr:16S rRNA (guanine(527)-N(7))-methyltransferase RsmG [[Lactobacillus] timonensis]MCI1925905.1 16S rRNA (guanine(527)-N(7))-methyltransferase RsmG [[Lactobacillus] timonensis]MCI1957265.1 16S rRNA (guanine(527)-N(7))-methyltransferase RsmG [[Lactobacillus] timonensis]MCI1970259.1 16S rRNA (guanine(527)-N(7))-methyltransferase RsmG [[Lactobacillus] timonensis]MCI2006459.1 16S rRNA (guanine(527)-N(7))-methyltransferase RsmG [[Lactobacillus] timonensis]